jgi:hypothetical protein
LFVAIISQKHRDHYIAPVLYFFTQAEKIKTIKCAIKSWSIVHLFSGSCFTNLGPKPRFVTHEPENEVRCTIHMMFCVPRTLVEAQRTVPGILLVKNSFIIKRLPLNFFSSPGSPVRDSRTGNKVCCTNHMMFRVPRTLAIVLLEPLSFFILVRTLSKKNVAGEKSPATIGKAIL